MSSTGYYIVGDRNVWVIQRAVSETSRSTSRGNAMAFAICAAQKLGMQGERVHVCVLDDYGHFRSRWTYNRDRHPRTRTSR
jgi:hypothetical protein